MIAELHHRETKFQLALIYCFAICDWSSVQKHIFRCPARLCRRLFHACIEYCSWFAILLVFGNPGFKYVVKILKNVIQNIMWWNNYILVV